MEGEGGKDSGTAQDAPQDVAAATGVQPAAEGAPVMTLQSMAQHAVSWMAEQDASSGARVALGGSSQELPSPMNFGSTAAATAAAATAGQAAPDAIEDDGGVEEVKGEARWRTPQQHQHQQQQLLQQEPSPRDFMHLDMLPASLAQPSPLPPYLPTAASAPPLRSAAATTTTTQAAPALAPPPPTAATQVPAAAAAAAAAAASSMDSDTDDFSAMAAVVDSNQQLGGASSSGRMASPAASGGWDSVDTSGGRDWTDSGPPAAAAAAASYGATGGGFRASHPDKLPAGFSSDTPLGWWNGGDSGGGGGGGGGGGSGGGGGGGKGFVGKGKAPAAAASGAAAAQASLSQDDVTTLMELGFSQEVATEALKLCCRDVAQAADMLLASRGTGEPPIYELAGLSRNLGFPVTWGPRKRQPDEMEGIRVSGEGGATSGDADREDMVTHYDEPPPVLDDTEMNYSADIDGGLGDVEALMMADASVTAADYQASRAALGVGGGSSGGLGKGGRRCPSPVEEKEIVLWEADLDIGDPEGPAHVKACTISTSSVFLPNQKDATPAAATAAAAGASSASAAAAAGASAGTADYDENNVSFHMRFVIIAPIAFPTAAAAAAAGAAAAAAAAEAASIEHVMDLSHDDVTDLCLQLPSPHGGGALLSLDPRVAAQRARTFAQLLRRTREPPGPAVPRYELVCPTGFENTGSRVVAQTLARAMNCGGGGGGAESDSRWDSVGAWAAAAAAGGASSGGGSIAGSLGEEPWTCDRCTLINDGYALCCNACETMRPDGMSL